MTEMGKSAVAGLSTSALLRQCTVTVRLFEVLLHGGPQVGGWTDRQIHHAVLTTFDPCSARKQRLASSLSDLNSKSLI